MHHQLTLASPAKLNLFLHITGRRADGYHDLQTVFQFIDFLDFLTFIVNENKQISLQSSLGIPKEDNLIFKAASLLQQETNSPFGAHISCTKHIPVGAGLGGGSSNAATTLIALNHLWQTQLSLPDLARLGLKLGADVPIFIAGQAAFAEGVGEKLQPILVPEPWYLLLIPPCEISTAKIFSDPQLTRNTTKMTIAQFLAEGGRNDCEAVVRKHYPLVQQAIDWLAHFAPAKLTGTGSCVFASFENQYEAQKVANQVQSPFRCVIAKGLNVSPLHKNIAKLR